MANKDLFKSRGATKSVPQTDTRNRAGGKAYKMSDRHALAQIAATNCFNGTFYATAQDNLKLAKDAALALSEDPEFIAKVAVYSRTKGYMKDMPAFLAVMLADTDPVLFRRVFRKVIDNGKMLRNFCQMARSGAVTDRVFNLSSGTCRHAIQEWFDSRNPWALFKASIGNDPSMRDILRMARPRPNTTEKNALFGYFLGKEVSEIECDGKIHTPSLPEIVQQYERYKKFKRGDVPKVDFRMLDSLGLGTAEWTEIARNAPWMMTRMNLNTFARHGVFGNREVSQLVADRLRNKEEIQKARQFPYQLYMAYKATSSNDGVPHDVREALQDAMEIAIENVPEIPGKVYVCVDTSGSMSCPITGRGSANASGVACVDVAGLFASAIVRRNRDAEVWTFSSSAKRVRLNPRDTVMTNTRKLAKAGGGTNISAPLRDLNAAHAKGDAVIYISDYESWMDSGGGYHYYGTGLQEEWLAFKKRNENARLICMDLTPRGDSQTTEREDILRVGGFSDQVFNVIANFVEHGHGSDHWVSEIEATEID